MINVFGLVRGEAKQGFVVWDKSVCLFGRLRPSPDLFYPQTCDKMANGCGTDPFVLVLSEGIYTDYTTALFLKTQLEKGIIVAEVKCISINTVYIVILSVPEENNGFHANSDKETLQLENAEVNLLHIQSSCTSVSWIIW